MEKHFQQIGVRVREMVRDDDERPAVDGGEMLEAEDRGVERHQPLGEEMVDAPRQRIRWIEGPVRAFLGETLTQMRQRVRSGLPDRAPERFANPVHRTRVSAGEKRRDGRSQPAGNHWPGWYWRSACASTCGL